MPWSTHWTEITPYFGFCKELNEVYNIKKAFEVFSSITFVSGKQEKDFGKNTSKFISTQYLHIVKYCLSVDLFM